VTSPAVELDEVAEVRVPVLLSIATAAKILGRSAHTVRRRINDGSLPAVVEHGQLMVRGDELREYIEGLSRPGGAVSPRRRARAASPFGRLAPKEAA
jgi:hypothetical protein